jgi:gas vesicle protein
MQIKSNLYNNALTQTSKNSENKRDDDNKVNIGKSILLGTVGGGLAGSALGWIQAEKKIKSLPVETVTLNIKEPIYKTQEIGKIPKDQTVAIKWWGGIDLDNFRQEPKVPIYKEVLVKDNNGNVVYNEYQKSFSGHGEPIVNYVTKQVKEPVFLGYSSKAWPIRREFCYTNDNCRWETTGYRIIFSPKVEKKVVDTYQQPVVKFKTGISVAEHVIVGGLIGAAVGGVLGGVVAAILNKLSESEDKESKK